MKNLQNLGKILNKKEQQSISGGSTNSSRCKACGGFPVSNGKCFGTEQVHCCFSGQCE